MIEDVLKQALEAMNAMLTHMGMDEDEWNKVTFDQMRKAITSIRQAIADLEKQEPVAWITQNGKGWLRWHRKEDAELNKNSVPLYTHPQRNPLTDEQIMDITMNKPFDCCIGFARAIEAAHGIKE